MTLHRVLHYECSGNCIFWRKDNHTDGQKDTHKEIKSDSKILKCDDNFAVPRKSKQIINVCSLATNCWAPRFYFFVCFNE